MGPFRDAWTADFEFRAEPGEHPFVVCLVARSFHTGREIRLWREQLLNLAAAPMDIGPDCVLVTWYGSAEIGCFLELGWRLPTNIVDLYAEHRVVTNGLILPKYKSRKKETKSGKSLKSGGRNTLLNALAIRGLSHIDADEKEEMRDLILSEPNPSETQKMEILDYCASDVAGTEALLRYMAERCQIDWPRALHRGRYVIAAARIERTGTPIDTALHQRLSCNWPALRRRIVGDVNDRYPVPVFDDKDSFKEDQFEKLVIKLGIAWPIFTTKDGYEELAIDKKTFDGMCRFHPELRPLYETRESLGKTRLTGISIGSDGRNRCLLSVFQSATGRNQPSNSKFIFGPAKWMRGLIQPPSGYGLAYVDWQAQEVAIAAALSEDERMIEAYLSGDVHFAFAKAAGLAPPDAAAAEYEAAREIAKTIVLGINYGMGALSMATRAGISKREARMLLTVHRITYRAFWEWAERTVNTALFTGEMMTKYGWCRRVLPFPNLRSVQNWPVQSVGAEMMRAAAIALTECGIEVCCPVHDAFLIMAPLDRLEQDIALTQQIMEMAADYVIGLRVRTDVKRVLSPARYMDKRGREMWDRIMGLLVEVEGSHHDGFAVERNG